MKILLVNDYSSPRGGAEVSLLHLRDLLRRLGHDARMFSTGVREGALTPEADYCCFGTSGAFRTLLQTANPWAARDLRRVVREFRPDVIHVKMFLTQLSPLIMPVVRETPSLYHVAWYRPICPTGSKLLPGGEICRRPPGWVCHRSGCLPMRDWIPLMAQMRMFRRNLDCFRMIVANSHATRRRLEAEGISPVGVLYYGFLQRVARRPLSDPPVVGFAGRLVREKGADVLVRAFASLTAEFPQAGLWIAGDGPERAPLARLCSDLGIGANVRFLGHLSRDEVESHFDSAWVQVIPSTWEEPFGLVAPEAMMRGTAVIASASGGLPESVVDGKTGLLFPPGDAQSLSRALRSVLASKDLAESMGHAGRESVLDRFSESRFAESALSLYRQAAGVS